MIVASTICLKIEKFSGYQSASYSTAISLFTAQARKNLPSGKGKAYGKPLAFNFYMSVSVTPAIKVVIEE
ncbi:hypothetical protein [Salinimonas chungwhensis]|jgi:hypothetical protein|uniref:hypothetical protein n=1 Tax=Salinimonas chungwhensis TaxID=265425 RepID=UPI000370F2C4|nr:hypothetical protein [Salinimonas chungwhensis]